jgi:hypothetical protein
MFRDALSIIRANRRAYITVNAIFYGLILLGALISALVPSIQQSMLAALRSQFEGGSLLAIVARVYRSGNIALAALATFLVNSVAGAFGPITIPSALIPFAGFIIGFGRALLWGLLFSPADATLRFTMIPHTLTVLLEGQGYVLATFGCYLWGAWILRPAKAGYASRKEAYVAGLRANVRIYSLVLAVLAVAAVYEAIEVCTMIKVAQ